MRNHLTSLLFLSSNAVSLPDTPKATPVKVSRASTGLPRTLPLFATPDKDGATTSKDEPADPWDAEDDMDDEFLYAAIHGENIAMGREKQSQL